MDPAAAAPLSPFPLPFPLPFDADVVQRVLRRLPPRQRQALHLRFADGLCEREIAAVLGCRTTTAHSLVRRGVRRTLQQLAREAAVDRQVASTPLPAPRSYVR